MKIRASVRPPVTCCYTTGLRASLTRCHGVAEACTSRLPAVPTRYYAKALAIALALLLLADTAIAQKEAGFVSLVLKSVSASRYFGKVFEDGSPDGRPIDSVRFTCDVLIDNGTGMDLAVPSTFETAYSSLELVVTDLKGKVLIQQPYSAHLSSRKPVPTLFPVRQGVGEIKPVFPIDGLGEKVKTVKVRLVGTFPGSAYKRILSSETVQVSIDESRREAR